MRHDDRIRLQHMLDSAREALGFARGRSREDLNNDRMLLLSIVKALEILGEAASQTSEETRAAHPEIPWNEIVGMRNRLVHAYFDMNLDVIWETIANDLPSLEREVAAILKTEK